MFSVLKAKKVGLFITSFLIFLSLALPSQSTPNDDYYSISVDKVKILDIGEAPPGSIYLRVYVDHVMENSSLVERVNNGDVIIFDWIIHYESVSQSRNVTVCVWESDSSQDPLNDTLSDFLGKVQLITEDPFDRGTIELDTEGTNNDPKATVTLTEGIISTDLLNYTPPEPYIERANFPWEFVFAIVFSIIALAIILIAFYFLCRLTQRISVKTQPSSARRIKKDEFPHPPKAVAVPVKPHTSKKQRVAINVSGDGTSVRKRSRADELEDLEPPP